MEVADSTPGVVAVRDSQDPQGQTLTMASAVWREFIDDVKAGQFDLG